MPPRRNSKRRKNEPRLLVHLAPPQLEWHQIEANRLSRKIRRLTEGRKNIMKTIPPKSSTPRSREILIYDLGQEIKAAKIALGGLRRKINAEMILQNQKKD